jgi:hypothetical protein
MTIPAKVQMWAGSIMALWGLAGAIMIAVHARAAFDWIHAYIAFCSASIFAGIAWRGYQRRPKLVSS